MKTNNYSLILLFALFCTTCSRNTAKEIVGKWQVSDTKTEMVEVHQDLIDGSKVLALSTQYEFKSDGRYCMTIADNEIEISRKHIGKFNITDNELTLKTDSLLLDSDGKWELLEKGEFNTHLFKVTELNVEETSATQIMLSQKLLGGKIYYTLDRISE